MNYNALKMNKVACVYVVGGERTLDLDILLYGDQIIQNERLTVPHYDMKNREFVIVPLNDIAQDLVLPEGEKVADLVKAFENRSNA